MISPFTAFKADLAMARNEKEPGYAFIAYAMITFSLVLLPVALVGWGLVALLSRRPK